MNATFYARLDGTRDVRRTLLETSKASIHVLRAYQDILRVRGEKAAALDSARKELRELTMLLNRLEKFLPVLSDAELGVLRPPMVLPDLDAETTAKRSGKPSKSKSIAPEHIAPKRTAANRPLPGLHERLAHIERALNDL